MENEKADLDLIHDYGDKKSNNIYKLEYEDQKLNNDNIVFLKWKQSMQKIYGENAQLFYCLEDKTYFYTSYDECKKYPVYQSCCPVCNQLICYYCYRYKRDEFNENGTCCLRRKIKCIFNQECYRYINPIYNELNINTFKQAFISFIIPVINLLTLIAQSQGIYFYKLIIKHGNKEHIRKNERYYQHLKSYDYVMLINMGMAVILVISLFLIHIYFIIFILLISLPFKFIPLKYVLGIHYATINLLDFFSSNNNKNYNDYN